MENTPDFVGGKVDIKTFDNGGKIIKLWIPLEEIDRIRKDSGVNIDIKFSRKDNKPYMENNSWQPQQARMEDEKRETLSTPDEDNFQNMVF
ncbi:MAG: hypothetical protein HOG49_41590 [Candidatus Scalindua sp.]|jgi:hypothetical protein|nr:hypothetical protein [Candidatus Scalindua sp.]